MPFIIPADHADLTELLPALLAAAGDDPGRVKTITSGPMLSFDVDDEIAAAVGYGTLPGDPGGPAPAGKSAGGKKGKTTTPAPSGETTETEGTP
jgi:hypothetical protein